MNMRKEDLMNDYSTKSKINLETVHEDLQKVFTKVLQICDHTVVYGERGNMLQNMLYAKGRAFTNGAWRIINRSEIVTYLQFPNSKHNIKIGEFKCKAVDTAPYINGRMVNGDNKDDRNQLYYFAGIVKGVSEIMYENGEIIHKIRWGGDWDNDADISDNNFRDLFHYEIID